MKRKLKYLKLPPPIIDLPGEIWKPVFVNNLNYFYEVSNKGRVKYFSRAIPCLLKLSLNNKYKYQCVTLYGYSLIPNLNIGVHRLVAIHFIDNPFNLPEVNHEDFNPLNNNDWNLKWVTEKENARHALLGGRYNFKFGEYNKASKLVLDLETGVYFTSLKEASMAYNLKYAVLHHRFHGRLINNTSLIYV